MYNVIVKMKSLAPVVLFCGLVLAGCGERITSGGPPAGDIAWHETLESGLKAAKAEKKLVFVDFSAEWCPGCKELNRVVLSKPEFAAMGSDYVFVHIDVDKERDTAARFGVRAIPDMRILDADGKEVRDVPVTWDLEEVVSEMKAAVSER